MSRAVAAGGAGDARRRLAGYLEYLREIGVTEIRTGTAARAAVPPRPSPPAAAERAASVPPAEALESLRTDEIGDCRRCGLCSARTHIVFGVGNASARLMFIGEGPGRDEDRQGEPFVGRAGRLLTDIIKAMKLERSQVYIANVVKCRPPENRTPEPDEVEACIGFLHRQIEIISPEVLVCLGGVAAQALLGTATGITRLRGQFREFRGVPLMATYHPAYLLRNPAKKREVWEDMKLVMARLGL